MASLNRYSLLALAMCLAVGRTWAQAPALERLPAHVLDAQAPAARVTGGVGTMATRSLPCRTLPTQDARRRIVQLAIQEWAFFGFPIVENTADEEDSPEPGPRRGRGRLGGAQAERVAASIGGYWAVTPGGSWILENQNRMWRESATGSSRWRYPWSAAFISWAMCEGGLGAPESFQRAIAHHTYIDQAIRARDGAAPRAAYVAHDAGEVPVVAGDLLCTSRRPVFRSLADRRRQMGQGARTHCDLVVKVDDGAAQILAIGGNVRGVVGLKVLPAARIAGGLRPAVPAGASNARPVFAHLRLRGGPGSIDAFDASPTLGALACLRPLSPTTPQMVALRELLPSSVRCVG